MEGLGERAHPRFDHVGEADEDGQVDVPAPQVVHELFEVDPAAGGRVGHDDEIAALVDREEIAPPVGDAIELGAVGRRPLVHGREPPGRERGAG
ncbi:MAG: hypothetical protein ACK56I_26380 [bacterium]